MMVLFIDGPVRGELRGISEDANDIVIPIPPLTTIDSIVEETGIVDLRNIPYFVHEFQLCGFRIRVASIHSTTEYIDPYDVFDQIVSDKARKATIQ